MALVETSASSKDLLDGQGFFTTMESFKQSWLPSAPTTVNSYTMSISENELTLAKISTAKVDFDDGVLFHLEGKPRPRHLRFHCKTSSDGTSEACDLRLAKRRLINLDQL